MEAANYNSLFRMTGLKRHFWGSIFALLLMANSGFASNLSAPATDFARMIAGVTGPGVITLEVTNSSSLTKSDAADIQHTLENQLRTAGVRFGSNANASTDVHVTLSENLEGYLWVAEISQGTQTQVQMISVPRTETPVATHGGPSVTIRKTLLFSQPVQILDAYVDGNRMTLLDAKSIETFSMNGGSWQSDQAVPFTASHNFPRDLRGLLVPQKDHQADVYLPGTVCNVSANSGMGVSCHDGDDPWPLGPKSALFNSGRNYFTGALFPASGRPTGPFYSLVAIPRPSYSLLMTTGLDGRVHLNDGVNERVLPSTSDWGSDISAVNSKCGNGTLVLVTTAGDDTVADSLRAFEIPDRDPVQVSAPLDFPGPITALWTHGDAATAITHNLRTGSYEAYSVSITCNQ